MDRTGLTRNGIDKNRGGFQQKKYTGTFMNYFSSRIEIII